MLQSDWQPWPAALSTDAAALASGKDPVAIASGLFSLLLGAFFLAFPSSFRGALGTHFSLAVMGCGFVAMGLNWPVAARWLAVPAGLMSLITFIGYVAFGPPGLDTLIIEKIWPNAPKSYSGDLNADLAYALTAIAVVFLTKPGWKFRWRPIAIVLAGSAVVGFGVVELTGYLTGLWTAYGLRRLIEVSVDSIVGVLILGGGLLGVSWRNGRHVSAERHAWILVVVAMSGVVVATSLWQALILVQKLPIESAQQFRSYLARTVFTFGLLATVLLGVAVSLVQKLRNLNDELERRVSRQTAELQAANTELEAFSYSVSHDLRSPLRAINGFSQILLTDHQAELSPDAQRHLERIAQSGAHMRDLIEALLLLSRLSRQALNRTQVRVEEIASRAWEELQADREGRELELVMGSLPPCRADAVLLQQVFVNLLSNAIKYSRPRARARIEIGTLETVAAPVYFVRDDGVGFDMRYADRLFGVFQRLHSRQEFEGTGVGLATVKRIVDRHGGRLWAEAEKDKGATFYFTLGQPEVRG